MSQLSRFIGSGCAAAASAVLVFATVPAQALPINNVTDPAAAAPIPAPSAAATAAPVEPKRYCMKDSTNSRITKKVCKTKEEWARSGVDLG